MVTQNSNATSPKFELGQVVATPGCLSVLEECGQSPAEFLKRHLRCEQGVPDSEDQERNAAALQDGGRILSAFNTTTGVKLWVITEAEDGNGHRSATTLLLPDEY